MGRRVGAQEEQLSRPVAHDDNMKDLAQNNKFLQQEASDDSIAFPTLYVSFSFEEEEEESHHPWFPLLCKNHVFKVMHAIIMLSEKINQGSSSL